MHKLVARIKKQQIEEEVGDVARAWDAHLGQRSISTHRLK